MGDEYRRWCKQSNTTSSPPSSSSLTGMESFLWPMDIDNDTTTKTSSALRTDPSGLLLPIHNPHMMMPLCPSSSSYPPLTTWNQPLLRGGGHQNFMKNQEEEEEKLYYGESEEQVKFNQSDGGLCCGSEGVDCGQGENNMNMMLPFFRKNDNYSSNCNNNMDGGVVMTYHPDFLRSPANSSRQLQQQQQQQLIISDVSPPIWNSGGVEGLMMSQTQILQGGMDLKSKDGRSKARGVVYKRSGKEMGVGKRQRSEVGSGLPAFKVRKEKMGDRITTLQQLVSPFGKTDTASVLSESIEYIKFLHHQVFVLCAPYINSGEKPQHTKVIKDLRSKGLCMVPISSTFTMVNESSADFLTPTYGGTFR